MKIPDEIWHCPKCGVGYEQGGGLTGPDYTTYEEFVDKYGKEDAGSPEDYGWCECGRCGWSGHVSEVVEASRRKQSRKPCPHCGGTGWVND